MTPAEHARNSAISFECKKDALQQRQSGDWKISFTVQGVDMDERITRAPMGTRFVAVLVEVGEDELPVPAKETAPTPGLIAPKPDRAKQSYRDLAPANQAGIRCDDPVFIAFLKEQRSQDWREAPEAAQCVRLICGVKSRAEFGTNHAARVMWHQLDEQFGAWKALEHA